MSAKYRSIILTLSLALGLLLFALPLQASTVNTTVLPDIENIQFDGTESTGSRVIKWKFSWDSVPSGTQVSAQVQAASTGSFAGLWVSVDVSASRSNGRTRISFLAPPSNNMNVRFQVSNDGGQSTVWESTTASSS